MDSNFGSDRIAKPTASRLFAPSVRSGTWAFQDRFNKDSRNNDRVNMSGLFKPFGLQTGTTTTTTTLDSIGHENARLRQSTSITSIRSSNNVSTVSRTFGLRPENVQSSNTQNNSRFNQDIGNARSSFVPTSFGLQMRRVLTLRDMPANDNSKFNQDSLISNYKNASDQFPTSNTTRVLGPAFRNTTLTNGLQVQERFTSDELGSGMFRVPSVPKLIKGRNPISSLRLFSHQSIDKSKNLSNINSFDVSHISRRETDTMLESRLGLMRNGWMDKHTVCDSIYSTGSVKAQAMNLLEDLHYSILNMGPYLSVDAVTMEIEKMKEGLENICEINFAPSVKEADAVSVASRYTCPANNDQTMSVLDGECVNLKSSKEVLKSLAVSNSRVKSKLNLDQTGKKSSVNTSVKNAEVNLDQEDSCLVFKKPKLHIKKKKSPGKLKISTPPVMKSLISKGSDKIINLKQWYPIAVRNDLALGGVDEQGINTKTDAIKKRINNRKVELVNGLNCNLIGSPSKMASALPKNVLSLIKNGLTPRWRVLQKELLKCQTAEEKKQKRKSKSPTSAKVITTSFLKKTKSPKEKEKLKKRKSKSPNKKGLQMSLRSPQKVFAKAILDSGFLQKKHQKTIKKKEEETPKVKSSPVKKIISEERSSSHSKIISSPKKNGKDVRTRSGRTVKPPTMFWIGSKNSNTPSLALSVHCESLPETPVINKKKTIKKSKKTDSNSIQKASNESSVVESHVNSAVSVEESPKKSKAVNSKKPAVLQKEKQKRGRTKKTQEVVEVVSFTEEFVRATRAKRKLEINAETECTQRKKSKIENLEEPEVKSTVTKNKETANNNRKQTKTETVKKTKQSKANAEQQSKKKKDVNSGKIVKSSSENTTETKFMRETEDEFELQLDDIEIPQFGNLSGNPQLSKSQLRLVSAETPPLKYFNSNLKILSSVTPVTSPQWVVSQRTESEVKQFQKRRAEAFKKKVEVKKTVESNKTVVTAKTQTRDLKKVLEWVAEKTVQSPQWSSKVLQYVMPSRRQLEQQQDEEEDEDESEFV